MFKEQNDHLNGVWIPTHNWVVHKTLWPRLVFINGKGYFEDGDHPAIYSVEHFSYSMYAPTVLEVTQSKQEFLNKACTDTEFEESRIEKRFYDITFHRFGTSDFFLSEFPSGSHFAQYFKTSEIVTNLYQPTWRMLRRTKKDHHHGNP